MKYTYDFRLVDFVPAELSCKSFVSSLHKKHHNRLVSEHCQHVVNVEQLIGNSCYSACFKGNTSAETPNVKMVS